MTCCYTVRLAQGDLTASRPHRAQWAAPAEPHPLMLLTLIKWQAAQRFPACGEHRTPLESLVPLEEEGGRGLRSCWLGPIPWPWARRGKCPFTPASAWGQAYPTDRPGTGAAPSGHPRRPQLCTSEHHHPAGTRPCTVTTEISAWPPAPPCF